MLILKCANSVKLYVEITLLLLLRYYYYYVDYNYKLQITSIKLSVELSDINHYPRSFLNEIVAMLQRLKNLKR